MSELSTVAIKDGHRGHLPHHHAGHNLAPTSGPNSQLDAERADRISRLAGLERVTTARNPPSTGNLTPGAIAPSQPTHSYFDASGNPAMGRERSTVGSASATGSTGAPTTWAGSEAGDADKMSENQDVDMDTSSVGGMSDEGTPSLVGFGEGARTPARQSVISSPGVGGKGTTPTAKAMNGLTYERNVMDTSLLADSQRRGVTTSAAGVAEAERIVRQNMDTTSADRMRESSQPSRDLGKFGFEK